MLPDRVKIVNRRFRVGGLTLVQLAPTTCASTVVQALGFLSGTLPVRASSQAKYPVKELKAKLRAEQLELQGNANVLGLAKLRWPRVGGMNPWALTRLFAWPGYSYQLLWTGSARAGWNQNAQQLCALLDRAVPVPLLVGGSVCGFSHLRIPQHYVLALPWSFCASEAPAGMGAFIYDPSSGRVECLDLSELDGKSQQRALGGWTDILAVYWPRPLHLKQ